MAGIQHSLATRGAVLTLHSVTRAASGVFLCRASNGVGRAATDRITLHVLYAPHVRPVERVLEGGAGQRAVLACTVHSEPSAEVVWYKVLTAPNCSV